MMHYEIGFLIKIIKSIFITISLLITLCLLLIIVPLPVQKPFKHTYSNVNIPKDFMRHHINVGAFNSTVMTYGPFRRDHAVILLHGFPDTVLTYVPMMRQLTKQGYFCLAPVLRGYEPSSLSDSYRLTDIADDIIHILDAFDLDRVHIIGHDWGAIITNVLIHLHSSRFISATLMAIPAVGFKPENFVNNTVQLRNSWYIGFFQLKLYPEYRCQQSNFEFIENLWRDWSPSWAPPKYQLDGIKTSMKQPGVLRASLSYYRHIVGPAFIGEIPYLSSLLLDERTINELKFQKEMQKMVCTVPVQVIHGMEDGCIDKSMFFIQDGKWKFPMGYRLKTISACGHFLHLEATNLVAKIIHEWIKIQDLDDEFTANNQINTESEELLDEFEDMHNNNDADIDESNVDVNDHGVTDEEEDEVVKELKSTSDTSGSDEVKDEEELQELKSTSDTSGSDEVKDEEELQELKSTSDTSGSDEVKAEEELQELKSTSDTSGSDEVKAEEELQELKSTSDTSGNNNDHKNSEGDALPRIIPNSNSDNNVDDSVVDDTVGKVAGLNLNSKLNLLLDDSELSSSKVKVSSLLVDDKKESTENVINDTIVKDQHILHFHSDNSEEKLEAVRGKMTESVETVSITSKEKVSGRVFNSELLEESSSESVKTSVSENQEANNNSNNDDVLLTENNYTNDNKEGSEINNNNDKEEKKEQDEVNDNNNNNNNNDNIVLAGNDNNNKEESEINNNDDKEEKKEQDEVNTNNNNNNNDNVVLAGNDNNSNDNKKEEESNINNNDDNVERLKLETDDANDVLKTLNDLTEPDDSDSDEEFEIDNNDDDNYLEDGDEDELIS